MMGGNIKVKSELGKGSEITIGLRFKTTSATKNRGVIQELNGFRALVADDNMDSCVSVEKMLRTIGLRPEWTTSGKEAVFRAKYATEQNDPFHANKPIIAMTAYAFEEDVKAALAAGMNEHLSKPIRIELLYEIMKKYL